MIADPIRRKLSVFNDRSPLSKILLRLPPSPRWKYERQTTPPNFGWARMASQGALDREVKKRRGACKQILSDSASYCDFEPGKVSIVILTCKRWRTLERLIDQCKNYFGTTESYPNLESILVDNGSGRQVVEDAKAKDFFDEVLAFETNQGMVGALREAFQKARGEYILLLEDDFVIDTKKPFLGESLELFSEFPEIGLIRLKNQNNWWKPHRVISPPRRTSGGHSFRTWLPSRDGTLNGWCSGSVLFRKVSYFATGELPEVNTNPERNAPMHQGYIFECVYGKKYNAHWLSAKPENHWPFFQPNDNEASVGWGN